MAPQDFAVGYNKRLGKKQEGLDRRFQNADFVVAGVARMLDCKIWRRFDSPGYPFARNVLTDPSEQQSSDLDNRDMALRFQQSTVEKVLPDPNPAQTQDNESCVFKIFLCVKNLWGVPVYLIPVREVIERHLCRYDPEKKSRVIAQLKEPAGFERRGPRAAERPTAAMVEGPILVEDFAYKGDLVMLFDHERVRPRDPGLEEALRELREAIRRARRDAIRIDLKPGDVLIVDNLRSMVSRREYFPTRRRDVIRILMGNLFRRSRIYPDPEDPELNIREVKAWPFKPHRWLRSYYAFRVGRTQPH
jgi:hypothetical protein